MKKGMLGLGAILAMLILAAAAEAQLFLPHAGEDSLPATEAELEVTIGGGEPKALGCSGPTTIQRGEPAGGVIQTEIVQMSLSCSEGIKVRESPSRPSRGQIQASGDSFFDVFVEIDVPGMGTLHNEQPARVQSTIGHIPPLGSIYFGVQPVTLFTTAGQPVAQLKHVKHRADGVPKPESSGEFSRVFSCFYECKPTADGLKYQEVTTLMLLNQSDKIPITADILFVDGNEHPIARARTVLSPLDLDEVSVCHTLQGLPAPALVPPAGLIEVVLSPTGGAYGWVKNVLGAFSKTQPDPFKQAVKGIAKTECRLVGPNVVSPGEILAIQAPLIVPVLIEQTGE